VISDTDNIPIPSIKTVRSKGKKSKAKKHDTDDDNSYMVPLIILEQARKEKYLVENFLQRYQQAPPQQQPPEYLSNSQDELHLAPMDENSITNILNIYTSAPVCQTCYLIYKLIHNARAKSMVRVNSMTRKSHQRNTFYSTDRTIANEAHVPLSYDCQKEGNNTMAGMELIKASESVLVRSLLAIQCVSKADLHEIRSYQNPPSAVLMSVSALFIVLLRDNNGKRYGWMEARRTLLSNIDQLFHEMSYFTPKDIKLSQWEIIDRHILQNIQFRPEKIMPISTAAAKICAWVLGMTNGFRWQQFLTTDYSDHASHRDPLINFPDFATAAGIKLKVTIGDPEKNWSDEMELRNRLKVAQRRNTKGSCNANNQLQDPLFDSSKGSREDYDATSLIKIEVSPLQQVDIQMEPEAVSSSHFFTSSTAMARIPYEVLSSPENTNPTAFFVVCHDIFDTLESTKLLFLSLIERNPKCKVLLFNYPGQARTDFLLLPTQLNTKTMPKETNEPVLHNDFLASILNELLIHVKDKKEFEFTNGSCYLVGFGIGVPVTMSFALSFRDDFMFSKCLKAIISINGCIHIDSHLASILHTSLNLFRSVPESQSEQALAYFEKHFCSDTHGDNTSMRSALEMFTAVVNPITVQGQIKLCNGALKNRDLRQDIANLIIPIVAVKSTENVFILPKNTDLIMEKRSFIHILSQDLLLKGKEHECCYTKTAKYSISSKLMEKKGGVVVSIQGGHAVARESMRILADTFSILADLENQDNVSSDFEPQLIKSELRHSELKFLEEKSGQSLFDCLVENSSTVYSGKNKCSYISESMSNNYPAGQILGRKYIGMSDTYRNHSLEEEKRANEDASLRANATIEDLFKVTSRNSSKLIVPANAVTCPDNLVVTQQNSRHESLLQWLFDESGCSLEKFSETISATPCLPEQESLPDDVGSKSVESMFSSNAKEHNQHIIYSGFQRSPSDLDHSAKLATTLGFFYLDQYKEERIKKLKLEEAMRSHLASGIAYDFSYSHNCVETAIHKLKTSPLFDAFNTAHTTIANTPPTYEEIIRQATAELENEQARDILKIKNMKTAKQHQFSSLHQPIKSSRQGVIKGSYQRKAAPEKLSQQLQKLCRGCLERRKVKKMKHMTVHLNKVATLSLIIQRYSRSKLAQKHVRRIHNQKEITLYRSMIALNLQRLRRKQYWKRQVNLFTSTITIQTWARKKLCQKKAKQTKIINNLRQIDFNSASKVSHDIVGRQLIKSYCRSTYFSLPIIPKIQRIWRDNKHFRLSKNQQLRLTHSATTIQRLVRRLRSKTHQTKILFETQLNSSNYTLLETIEEARKKVDSEQLELDCIKECRIKAERLYSSFCKDLRQSEQEFEFLQNEVNPEKGQVCKRKNIWKKNEMRTSKLKHHDEIDLITIAEEVEKNRDKLKKLELAMASIDEDKSRKEADLRRAEEHLSDLLQSQNTDVVRRSVDGAFVEMKSLVAKTPISEGMAAKLPLEILSQQEEFLKFQLMSMSLSYLSSMKLLKDLKNASDNSSDIAFTNTTESVKSADVPKILVSGPSSKESENRMCNMTGDAFRSCQGASDPSTTQNDKLDIKGFVGEVAVPTDCRLWTISHVSKWLHGLSLGKYVIVSFIYLLLSIRFITVVFT